METILKPNIAFFDSGQGGLTVWEKVLEQFPRLNTVYLGDNARCPYGNKASETIIRYSLEGAKFLESQNAKLLVVACGTASSVAIDHLKSTIKPAVIGVIDDFSQHIAPTLKDKNLPVAILGTNFTIQSRRLETCLTRQGFTRVWTRACPLFVPLVEEGFTSGEIATLVCQEYLADLPEKTQAILLACTHYPRLVETISKFLEKKFHRPVLFHQIPMVDNSLKNENSLHLFDASLAVIHLIETFLNNAPVPRSELECGQRRIFCTDSPVQFRQTAQKFMDKEIKDVVQVNLPS